MDMNDEILNEMIMGDKRAKADEALGCYAFEPFTFEDDGGWEDDGYNELLTTVYLADPDYPNNDTISATLAVTFEPGTDTIKDVVCTSGEMDADIGFYADADLVTKENAEECLMQCQGYQQIGYYEHKAMALTLEQYDDLSKPLASDSGKTPLVDRVANLLERYPYEVQLNKENEHSPLGQVYRRYEAYVTSKHKVSKHQKHAGSNYAI